MTTKTETYKVRGHYGKYTPVDTIMSAKALSEWLSDPCFHMASAEPISVSVSYVTADGCERCTADVYVPHYNCNYNGSAIGHSASHCTADGCY
jgi:hypothetical protein